MFVAGGAVFTLIFATRRMGLTRGLFTTAVMLVLLTAAIVWAAEGLRKSALRVPESSKHQAEVLGEGVDAVPSLVRVLEEWGVLS